MVAIYTPVYERSTYLDAGVPAMRELKSAPGRSGGVEPANAVWSSRCSCAARRRNATPTCATTGTDGDFSQYSTSGRRLIRTCVCAEIERIAEYISTVYEDLERAGVDPR